MSEERPENELEKLDARLREARGEAPETGSGAGSENQAPASAAALAFRVGVELVSALAVGFGIGWLLDAWLDTRPWLMLVFILLGGAAGILNVFRVTRGYGYAAGYQEKDRNAGGKAGDGPGM